MAQVSIVHTTEYNYRNPVGLLRHRLMVRPDESHDLRLHGATIKVEPEPTGVYWKHDVFNNSICFLEWPEALRTKRLSIVSTLDMTHHPDGPPLPVYSLDETAELFPFSYAADEIPDLERLAARQMPDPDRKVDAWARRVVSRANSKKTLEVLEAMTHAIKDEFRYGARHEEGTQTAALTLELGSGTCRDFAVLMMAICTMIPRARPEAAAARTPGVAFIYPAQVGSSTIRRTAWSLGRTSFALV